MLHVDISKSLLEIRNSHDNIMMLHVDVFMYFACRGQKYAAISNG